MINKDFLDEHELAAKLSLLTIDHVIIYVEGDLKLWQRAEGSNFKEIASIASAAKGRLYKILKEVGHIPVLLTSMIEPIIKGLCNLQHKKNALDVLSVELKAIYKQTYPLLTQLGNEIDMSIIIGAIELLEIIKTQPFTQIELKNLLKTYLNKIKPTIGLISRMATNIQLTSCNDIVMEWLKHVSLDLEKTRVLVVGTHGPRNGLIEMQYFESLYLTRGLKDVEDDKVYYVESLLSHIAKINIKEDLIEGFLAGSEINKNIGDLILDDSKGMFQDVLHAYAPSVLEHLFETEQQKSDSVSQTKKVSCPYHL